MMAPRARLGRVKLVFESARGKPFAWCWRGSMDGGEIQNNYASKLTLVTEGEWAGWSWYPGGDPFEDLAGPFYFRGGDDGRPLCAFRAALEHLNGGPFM